MSYFISTYCYIYNATERDWVRFDLWPAQRDILDEFGEHLFSLVLKARQLGLSWLTLCYALWLMRFHPAVAVLIFSKRDEEAIELLGRVRGVHQRLPEWMRSPLLSSSKHEVSLANGSTATAFPTTGGRSYTGSLVIVDEADFVQDLDALLNAVKPTIDAGGQMIMISTVDKSQPESPFKRIYRAAKRKQTEWRAIFLPWHARPGRTDAWYEAQKADILARTTALDDLHQEYPATDTEALAPRSLDKRISPVWIEACYEELDPLYVVGAPAIPGLEVYRLPEKDVQYIIGGDPAEGNPTSDDSALTVLDLATGEECACLAGKFEPSTLGSHIKEMSAWYNNAPAMIERNNHGHAVIQWVDEHARRVKLLKGHDDKPGWMSSKLGKALLYTECANHFRLNAQACTEVPLSGVEGLALSNAEGLALSNAEGLALSNAEGRSECNETKILHSFSTYQQLASIEGATLLAPEGQHDDRADSYALAQVGRAAGVAQGMVIVPKAAALFGSRQSPRADTRRPQSNDRRGLHGSRT